MNLSDIKFPIYRIPDNVENELGVIYVTDSAGAKKIVDNLNLPGHTLSQRRLKLPKIDKYTPKIGFNTPEELIRSRAGNYLFIDRFGKIFRYTRSFFVRLTCRPFEEYAPLGKGWLIKVKGLPMRFFYQGEIPENSNFVVLLEFKQGFMLYGFSEERVKDSARKI